MTVHSVTIRTMVSGTTIVLRNEEGWIICERLISEAGLESLQQAAADLVFGSQEEQAVSTHGAYTGAPRTLGEVTWNETLLPQMEGR